MIAHEGFIDIEHLLRFLARFSFSFMDGMPFLPEKFSGPQKDAGPHLPADDVGPLVDENRQVAIRLHPLRVARADDGLAGGPHDERLGELLRRRRAQTAASLPRR